MNIPDYNMIKGFCHFAFNNLLNPIRVLLVVMCNVPTDKNIVRNFRSRFCLRTDLRPVQKNNAQIHSYESDTEHSHLSEDKEEKLNIWHSFFFYS